MSEPEAHWGSQLDVGVEAVDRQHRQLVALVDALESATEGSREAIHSVLKALLTLTRRHFDTEQKLMRESNYLGRVTHEAEHRQLLARIERLLEAQASGRAAATNELVRSLRPWLRDHVQGLDRALATHLQARAVGEPKA